METWLRTNWAWVAAGGVVFGAVCYGAGYYTAPSKVTERTEAAWTSTWDWARVASTHQVAAPVRRVTTKVTRPAAPVPVGCPECPPIETTTIEEDIGTVTTDTATADTARGTEAGESSTVKVTERDAPRLTLVGTFGMDVTNPRPVYGGAVLFRVAGPLTIGAGFDSSLRATVAAGLTF